MMDLEEINQALKTLQAAYEKYTDRKVETMQISDDYQLEGLMWRLHTMFKILKE